MELEGIIEETLEKIWQTLLEDEIAGAWVFLSFGNRPSGHPYYPLSLSHTVDGKKNDGVAE